MVDFSGLLGVMDFGSTGAAILAVAAALMGVYVVKFAARMVVQCANGPDGRGPVYSREDYAFRRVVEGDYVPRGEFEKIAPRLGDEQKRRYARHMSRYW